MNAKIWLLSIMWMLQSAFTLGTFDSADVTGVWRLWWRHNTSVDMLIVCCSASMCVKVKDVGAVIVFHPSLSSSSTESSVQISLDFELNLNWVLHLWYLSWDSQGCRSCVYCVYGVMMFLGFFFTAILGDGIHLGAELRGLENTCHLRGSCWISVWWRL